ncbi:MAG TPA: tetratricopeptide repeat protein [Desulfobacterales bacterium]|nr:tetratricopeptide repeat protein [Desulfobacterales bacterium]
MASGVFKWVLMLALGALTLSGCATPISEPPSIPPESPLPASKGAEEIRDMPAEPSPRALASLRLTDQGRMLLERGRTDDAISLLERAMGLHPTNGENYYYLAEAWLLKGRTAQAEEFNRLAGIYLEKNARWMGKVIEQKRRIKMRNES